MRKRYLCPRHRENSPSAVIYSNGYYCFGCGSRGAVEELGIPAGDRVEIEYVEDLEESISAIKLLPKCDIRGFKLHGNSRGYYLLWPSDQYYKYRSLSVDTPGGKYRGPSGHRKPPFVAVDQGNRELALVEGEFNALSLASLELPLDVVSPGGAGDFYSSSGIKLLANCTKYDTIYLIVDADAAGVQAAIEAKSRLTVYGCNTVHIHVVEKDFNDVHVEQGQEALRNLCRNMGLPP